jgi:lysophospholipase L1-like esterase
MLGDSLTDGRGSTTNANDRWPDRLLDRLAHLAVLNQAAGGNRLREGLLARLDRDVLALGGVAWLVVFAGVNDVGTAQAGPPAQQRIGDDVIAAHDQIIVRAAGLRRRRPPAHQAAITR